MITCFRWPGNRKHDKTSMARKYCNNELASSLSAKVFNVQASHFVIGCYSIAQPIVWHVLNLLATWQAHFYLCMGLGKLWDVWVCIWSCSLFAASMLGRDMVNFEEVMNVVEYVLPFGQLRVHPALVVSSRQFVPMPVSPHVLLSLSSITFFFWPTTITTIMVCGESHTRLAFIIHIPVLVITSIVWRCWQMLVLVATKSESF